MTLNYSEWEQIFTKENCLIMDKCVLWNSYIRYKQEQDRFDAINKELERNKHENHIRDLNEAKRKVYINYKRECDKYDNEIQYNTLKNKKAKLDEILKELTECVDSLDVDYNSEFNYKSIMEYIDSIIKQIC